MRTSPLAILLTAAVALAVAPAASGAFVHTVAPGESLTSIAATDGLTIGQLAAANGLPPTAELTAGSQLLIPPQEAQAPIQSAFTAGAEAEGPRDYDSDDRPEGETASPAVSQPVGAAAEGSPGGPPYPTPETVSPSQVASIAAANGVPASLANAIAYQESGFNNDLVSVSNARGVMQITPGTWSWIAQELAGEAPLAPASALENVRAGALLLHSLLQATDGNEELAIAGYFQGLPSVLEYGIEPATQQYVEDVEALQQRFGG